MGQDLLRGGRYELKGVLGAGAQGTTREGVDRSTGLPVAIKEFSILGASSWKRVELAEREAHVLATLSHPGLPKHIEHFEEAGKLYLVMAKIEGETLEALCQRPGRLSQADVVRFLADASAILDYLHGRAPPIVHRDINPRNVIRRPDGSYAFVDFGAVQAKMKPEGGSTFVGTPGYMAPEQLQGRAAPVSDVYAVGATVMRMLTGIEPFELPHRGLAIDVEAALGAGWDPWLKTGLARLLDPNPDTRSRRIGLQGMRALVAGAPVAPGRPSSSAPAKLPSPARAEHEAAPVLDETGGSGRLPPDDAGTLRWYQREAVDRAIASVSRHGSALIVFAPALGYTAVIGEVAKRWTAGAVLFLVRREEFAPKARAALEAATGSVVGLEHGDESVSSTARVVVASARALQDPGSCHRLQGDRFGLVMLHEAHRYLATAPWKLVSSFRNAKVLGIAATLDRGDEVLLGQVFNDVAYCADPLDGIDSGYLVQLEGEVVTAAPLDLSRVPVSRGDFYETPLDELLCLAAPAVVAWSLRRYSTRPGLWFWPAPGSTQRAAELFNERQPGSTGAITRTTPMDEIRNLSRSFRENRLARLCVDAAMTDYFDAPRASLVVMARPTQSRALFARCVGMGMRPTVRVDHHTKWQDAWLRRGLIEASGKPACRVVVFSDASGPPGCIRLEDLLGCGFTEAEIARAKQLPDPRGDVKKALEDARTEVRQHAEGVRRLLPPTRHSEGPLSIFGLEDGGAEATMRWGHRSPTPDERRELLAMGVTKREADALQRSAAQQLISTEATRAQYGLASFRQVRALGALGVGDRNLRAETARKALEYVEECGTDGVNRHALEAILDEG